MKIVQDNNFYLLHIFPIIIDTHPVNKVEKSFRSIIRPFTVPKSAAHVLCLQKNLRQPYLGISKIMGNLKFITLIYLFD